jgi:hypothetical protein
MNFVLIRDGQAPEELGLRRVAQYLSSSLNISLPSLSDLTDEQWPRFLSFLAEHSVYPLTVADTPTFDPDTEKLGAYQVEQINGAWIKSRPVVALSSEELAQVADRKLRNYQKDLVSTAGRALVEWQAGDATQQDFLDAVAAVKALHGRT